MNLIEHVKKSVENSRNHISDIDDRVLAIEGMSNRKVRHLFNNITKIDNCNYLEIGCWKGSTCISALYKNKINKHWIIDNFSLFGGPREEFLTNFRTILGYEPNLIDKHYRSFDPVKDYGIENVNVYFYDGEHDDSRVPWTASANPAHHPHTPAPQQGHNRNPFRCNQGNAFGNLRHHLGRAQCEGSAVPLR